MKSIVKYSILYKNGFQDIVKQLGTDDEHETIAKTLMQAMSEDLTGYITLGDGEKTGMHVRLSDVSRVFVEIIEEGIES